MSDLDTAPFSVSVNVRRLPKKGHREKYSATEEAREAIAKRYELIGVDSFNAEAVIAPWKKDGVKIEGQIRAKLVQPCAVSGDPIDVVLKEQVDAIFVPDGSKLARPPMNDEGELIFDSEGDDLPETFVGDSIDLADVWLEFFALGLDPFAKKEGAEFDADAVNTPEESPFAALEALKDALKKQ